MKSMLLCYNLKGTKKGRKLGMLGSFLGFRVKYVEKEDYAKTIGELAGLSSAEKNSVDNVDMEKEKDHSDFDEEMIVMLLADSQILDKLLFQMRKEKVQVPLKAIVTAKNQSWTSTVLYKEVKREHESMLKAEQETKESAKEKSE